MASNGRFEYTIGFKTDDSGLKQARKALQEIQNLTVDSPGVTGVSANLTNAKAAAAELEIALTKAFNVKMGTTSIAKLDQELKNLNRPLSEIYEDMKSIGPAGEAAFNKIAVQAMKTNLQIKQGNTILEKFGKTLWRNVEWLISGNLINTVTGVFTKAYGYTKNLDESLNNIRIVTGKGADEMERFGKEAQETAARLGKGTTDITNASLIFYQQGLDKAEVDARTEVATKLANVSQQSADTTADQLTAVWNGFQAGTDELERYADVMTAVAASTASDSAELAGSISKVASVAHTTGVDMEQLTAMMSTVISVTRDSPETVGTAFKTIFARMDDLVEDGTDEFGVSLGRVSSHLKSMGIEILNEDGTLRNLGTTLTETGDKWKSYSREQQVAIAEQMGGKRQWNQVLALFDNWDMYKDTLDTARDSTGALQEQQDIYMESTQAHLQAVKTAWEGVYGELMTADNINTVADAVSKILETIKSVIQALGGVKPILTTVAGLMMQAFSGQIAQNVVRIADNIKKADYNKMERAAQQSLTAQFGQLDSSLMKELTGYHEKILKYQKDLTPEQKKEYETLLDLRVEAENKYNILKKENDELDKLLGKYTNLNNVSNIKNDKGSWNVGILEEEIGARQAAIQQTAETGSLTGQTGRDISLGWTQEDASQTEQQIALIEGLDSVIMQLQEDTSKLGEAKKQATTEEDINNITELQSAYRAVKEELASYTEIIRTGDQEAIDSQKQVVDNAIKNLQKLETSMNGGWQAANTYAVQLGGMITGWENFSQTLADVENPFKSAQLKIKNITDSLQQMGEMGVLTQEDVAALVQEYQNFGNSINESTSTEKISQGFETLKQKVLHTGEITEQELQQILKGVMEGIPQQTANVKAQIDNIKQSMQDLQSNLDFTHIAKQFTLVIGSVGRLAGSIQSLSNISKILTNEDLEPWEKFVQVLQNATFAGPMFVSSIVAMTKGSIGLVNSIKDAILAMGLKMQVQQLENTMTKEQIKDTAILILTEQGLSKEEVDTAIAKMSDAEMSLLVAKNQFIQLTATEKLTLAQLKLNAAMRAHPLIAILTIFTLLVAAIAGLSVWLDKLNDKFRLVGTGIKVALALALIPFVGILGPAAVLVGSLIKKLIEWIKVSKEQEEAAKKAKEATEKYISSSKQAFEEATKAAKENLEALKGYDQVWKSFQEGKTSIDDFHDSMVSVLTDLGKIEDPAIVEKLALAKATGDYTELNAIVQEAEQKSKDAIVNAKKALNELERLEDSKNFKEEKGSEKIEKDTTGGDAIRMANRATGGKVNFEGKKTISDFSYDEIEYLRSDEGQRALANVEKTVEERMGEIRFELNRTDLTQWERDALEQEQATLEQRKQYIQGWASSVKSLFYDEDWVEKEAEMTKEDKAGEAALKYFNFDSETTDEQIKKAIQDYAKATGKTYEEAMSDAMTYEPDSAEQIAKIGAYLTKTTDSINQLIKDQNIEGIDLGEEVIAGNIANFGLKMVEHGVDINKIDLSQLDKEDLKAIALGTVSEESIARIAATITSTERESALLYSDWVNVGNAAEEFSNKLEKGMSQTDLDKLINTDEWQETVSSADALRKVFSEDKQFQHYMDILQDPDSHSTKELAEAWKYVQKGAEQAGVAVSSVKFNNIKKEMQEVEEYTTRKHEWYFVADTSEVQEKLDELADADNEINVIIKADIDTSVENFKTKYDDLIETTNDIQDGLIVSVDKLQELADTFPGILDGMTLLADGTYQLSQESINQVMENAEEELQIEKQKQLDKIDLQIALLENKKAIYQEMVKNTSDALSDDVVAQAEYDETIKGFDKQLNDLQQVNTLDTAIFQDGVIDDTEAQWKTYYSNIINYSDDWAKKVIQNAKAIEKLDESATSGKVTAEDIGESGAVYKRKIISAEEAHSNQDIVGTVFDSEAAKKHLQQLNAFASAGVNTTQSSIDALQKQRTIVEAWGSSYSNQLKQVGKATEDNADATKANTDATGDAAEAQQELLDLLNEEIDAYHDVTQQIERHTTALNRLQKAQEKATGKTLIKNLQDQMKAYQDLNNDYADKQLLQYEEAAIYRAQLEGQGVTFDENGVISNYSDILNQKQKEINADLSWYNSLSAEDQEAQKDWIESRQAEYDSLVDLIGNYDQLWNQDIPDLADEIAENIDKQVELELEIKKQIVQIEVDKGSLKRMEMELNKTLDNVQEKDLERNLAYNIQSYFTYSDEEKAKLKRYLEAKQKKGEADTSGEDLSAADLENYREALEDYNSIMQEKAKQANEIISSAFDGLNEKIERQKTQFETMSKLFEHDMNLIKLRYGDQAFEQLKTLYAAREENAKAQLSNANLALEVAQKELAAAQAKGDLDLVQAAQDKVTSALETQRQAVIDGINAIQDTAMNTVDAIFAHLDEQVAGVSFEKMKKQWDDMEKDSADYYDAINGAYEIEKLRTNMKKAINESGSAATQKALNNLMNEEITKLQQKDKLSKYDIERANALFDIEQKRAAFREAQNNKSKMRLRRDASGNYSYQFVSDEDKVTSAMQDLADAQNQLYNIDKEAYKNNLEKMQEYYLEYQEEMKAAANASAEERQAIEDRYMERVAELQEENRDASKNLIQDVVNDSEILTGKSIENIEDMTQAEVDALMGSVIPAWKSYLGVMSRSKDLLADMKQAGLDASQVFDTSKAKIDIEMALNGLSWDSLIEGFDPAVESIKTMTSSTDEIAQEVKNISAGVSQFIEAIKSNNFTEGLEKFVMALENGTLITPANIVSAINILPQRNAYISSDNMDTIVDSAASPMDRIITSYTQLKGEEARARRDQLIDNGVIFDADGIINNYAEIIKQKQLGLSADSAWSSSLSGEDQEIQKDWIKSRQAEYDNLIDLISGYDQLWNRGIPALTNEITKIAEEKTSNDLQERVSDLIDNSMFVSETVQFLADRLSKVYSQQSEILSETMDYLHTLSTAKEKERELQEYQPTVVNINADFPAVTSQHEIEQALDSLVARATQRAYRTVR